MHATDRASGRRRFLGRAGTALAALTAGGCLGEYGNTDMSKRVADNEASTGSADGLRAAADFLHEEHARGAFPGAALRVTLRGEEVLRETVGTCCDGTRWDAPFDDTVVNMVYSFSKVVTATVVAMVNQDGLLDYDTPVAGYIPEFAAGGKAGITLRHCLTHSAGIPTVPLGPALTEEEWQRNVAALCAHRVEWEPGSRTAYHALSGAFTAAAVVRRVCGDKPWNDICRERLFEPLGATSMTFGVPPAGTRVAFTPQPKELPVTLEGNYRGMLGHPGGGCLSRPDDMLRLLNLQLNRGVWRGNRLIREDAFAEMHRVQYADRIAGAVAAGEHPAHETWALGWLTRGRSEQHWFGFGRVVSERAFGHAGINTVIGVADPDTGLALAFLTTDSPASDAETIRLRNTVTDLVAGAIG